MFVDYVSGRPQISACPGSPLLLSLGSIKRGAILTVPVQFVGTDGTIQDLGNIPNGIIGFKPRGNHNAATYCAAAYWQKSGSGTGALYTFTVTFLTAPLNTLFAINDAAAADEVPFVDLIGEIKWSDGTGRTFETQPDFSLRVLNDVNQATTAVPVVAAAGEMVWLPYITGLTGNVIGDGVPRSLDALPTRGIYDSTSLILTKITGFAAFTFDAGAADPTDARQVAVSDYDVAANNFHFTQRI